MKNLNKIVRETFEKGGCVMSIEEVKACVRDITTLRLPNRLHREIEALPKRKLNIIDTDTLRAKETIYRLVHRLNRQYFNRASIRTGNNPPHGEGVPMYSKIMESMSNYENDNNRYVRIIKLLVEEGLIEMDKNYSTQKGRSRIYKYTEKVINSKLFSYELKHEDSIEMANKHLVRRLEELKKCPIAITAYCIRFKAEMPTEEEVEKHLVEAYKAGHRNSKGKLLKRIGKKSRSRFKGKYVFIEDYIDMYINLRDNFYIPVKGCEKSGGRVVTPFTLMPSIIRSLVKLNGNTLKESDYSAMHPNLVGPIHDVETKGTITHAGVAKYLNKDFDEKTPEEQKKLIKKVKIEHLSYFNMKISMMKHLKVNKYYTECHPELIEAVQEAKKEFGYKDTSSRLFTLETAIMTQVQKELLEKGIDAIYVYDCFMVESHNLEATKEIMQRVAEEFGTNLKVGN